MKESEKPIKTGRQISSGGVVFRRINGGIEVALIKVESSKGKVWSLPKGLKEEGENLAKTAHREVREETGLDGRIIGKLNDIHYFYSQKSAEGTKRIFKIVYFFLMEYSGGDVLNHDKVTPRPTPLRGTRGVPMRSMGRSGSGAPKGGSGGIKEVVDCKWFPIDEAIEVIAYKDEREILEKARGMIEGER